MRAGTTVALIAALIFGGLAAFLARTFILNVAAPQAPAQTSTIVVASHPLEFGANLTRDNLREIPWPADHLEGSFTTIEDLLKEGRRLTLVSMQKNEPILAAKITGPNQRATLSTLIDDGMRAVSVNVDEVRGVAGFILPGDRVDVILTRNDHMASSMNSGPAADVLLQNVKVLAIDQVANERTDKPTLARAVTLELDLQQSQKVILAQGIGRLSLILRQAGEAKSADARRVTLADLGMSEEVETKRDAAQHVAELEARIQKEVEQRVAQVAPVVVPPKRDDRVIVNVIRGITKRDEYTVLTEAR